MNRLHMKEICPAPVTADVHVVVLLHLEHLGSVQQVVGHVDLLPLGDGDGAGGGALEPVPEGRANKSRWWQPRW